MRIEAYNQIASMYKAAKPAKTQGSASPGGRDEVQISQVGRDYQVAKQAVAQASDVRMDKVAELKSRIASGEYQVSADDFASKLIAKYNQYQ
ncbi:MAG: flagellar biosynthesis anti-sigma factor FlgM [Lachnospiraceae bacterium]|nr:flagellar biosynthesis anti-sigma factor FlgM [Lachnospiraceae bacterium]MCI9150016.1 flagellar biosynthesis anti-sigma factor FlgM [Lachnospiraceae bacterium]